MSEHFINLNCANCGAKLDVYDDMERFSCGYCGADLIAQRRGGTVALKAVSEAIKKVQIGTDKAAAELALARLNQELMRLNSEVGGLTGEIQRINAEASLNKGCFLFIPIMVGTVGIGFIMSGSILGVFIGLLMAGGSLSWIVKAWTQPTAERVAKVKKQILEKEVEIDEVKARMVEQRRITESAE